jgi:hypothetical protein
MVQPAYAEPCVPPGQEVVLIVKVPPDAVTVTVAVAVFEPTELVAVSVYVVVAVGMTTSDPLGNVEEKPPGLMARLVAPVVDQFKLLLAPAVMLPGLAVKELMAGLLPVAVTVTVEVEVTEPAELVAVRV